MKKDILACGLAAAFAVGTMVATAGAEDVPQARVAFDRAGGFTVERGAEASVTARVEDGGGYGFRGWEGNAPGHSEGRRNETWVIDTGEAGEYWLRAIGWCDGTDDEVRGTIRFRVVEPARAARAAGEGETVVWSENFSTLNTGGSTALTSWNGWTLTNAFNGTNCFKVGSSKKSGEAISPSVSMGGSAGRVEFSLRAYGSDATTVTLSGSVDGGSWNEWGTYNSLTDPATEYSVDVAACQSVQFKWTGSDKRFHLGPVAVYQSGSGGGAASNRVPVLDLDPDVTSVTLCEGEMFNLAVTATEFDGDLVELDAEGFPEEAVWSEDGPGTGSVRGAFNWTPTTTGTWNVVFSATDKDGTTNRTVAFTVEPEGPGTLAFVSDSINEREGMGTVTLTVVRTGGAAGSVGVAWATEDGTAHAGTEYRAGSGLLAFSDGQNSKTLTVELLDDTAAEGDKTFTVRLGNVTGGASLGENDVCTVTIVDDDNPNADYYASCYENGVLKTGDDLKATLCQIVNTGAKTYTYGSGLSDILAVTDECLTNANQVQCIYLQHGIGKLAFNKEHIWAQSHGIDSNYPAYSDLHHVRACDSAMNTTRGDKDFDYRKDVSGAKETNGCWYTSKAFEPPDSAKGEVARALLYMAVRYQGSPYTPSIDLELVDSIGTDGTTNRLGKLSTLLEWNEQYLPNAFETNRHEKVYSYQKNRNPFVDNPRWARAVFDPTNFPGESRMWTVTVTMEGDGWVNNRSGAFATNVANGRTKDFWIAANQSEYYHIGSMAWNGITVNPEVYPDGITCNFTTPAVTNNSTLAVVFAPDLAALGTPIWWLVQYGYTNDWDAAELADPNDDGVPNWQEYLNGSDPTALSLRQVTGVTVTATNNAGFTLAWNAVDYADGYHVRVCSTAVVDAASAGFEGGTLDAGWSVSATGTLVATNASLAGEWGLAFSTNGSWLCSPEVTNPESVEFLYKRSGNNDAWTLAVEVSADGGTRWTEAGSVTNATTTAKTESVDLSAWYGQTVIVRLRDARESGNAARYVDAVAVKAGGATVAEATTSATTWTATGLDAGTGYDVFVRGEATTLGTAVGPWSAAVCATTAADASGRKPQSITFPAIVDQTVGATVTLTATATSGLEVTYSWSGPATLSGNMLACTGEGSVTVTASQAGNEEWAPAADVSRTFTVTAAPVELAAPESVWASVTNAKSFTAAWSAVDGALGYELSVWTGGGSETVVTTNETVLFSTNFASITGNANTALTANFIEGWTFASAYAATNEIRVGASGTGGYVATAPTGATGTVRVVTSARTWGTDSSVMWVGVTGCESQSNALGSESALYTNTFEGVSGEVTVCWSNAAGKKRFFLESVEVTGIGTGETETEGGTVPVPGYEALAVAGTSCVVTGLTASTEYSFKVRALAGEAVGPWSGTATVTTLAEDEPVEPEPTEQEKYEAWVTGLGLESTEGLEYATAENTDTDDDGATNWQEFLADTDPTDGGKFLRLAVDTQADGTWLARPDPIRTNRSYSLVIRTDLTDEDTERVIPLGTGTEGLAATNSMPEGDSIWFGTVRVQLEPDE